MLGQLTRGAFRAGKKLGSAFRKRGPASKEELAARMMALQQEARKAAILRELIDSDDYRTTLGAILQDRYDKAMERHRQGDLGSSIDELHGIEKDMKNLIARGDRARRELETLNAAKKQQEEQ